MGMHGPPARSFVSAARARIAAGGIRGLSLRAVAQDAGASLGALNYHIGDKAALVAALIAEERAENRAVHARWLDRAARLDLADAGTLAAIVIGYLDAAADTRRDAALAGCELLLEAGADPAGFAGIGALLDEEDAFWRAMLARDHGGNAPALGLAIAGYCRDEMPFSIAAGHHADYRLLRAATAGRLAEGLAGRGGGLSRHFEGLVAACGEAQAASPLPVDLPPGARKTELALHIADLIAEQGVASITHRLVAARAGVPNSSVAHHFRTRENLLDAGMGALILGMRRELSGEPAPDAGARRGTAVVRATHSIALAAARDPHLVPFALDMRRRRAENVWAAVGEAIAGPEGLDAAATQAAVMVMVGSTFAHRARGVREDDAAATARLAALRRSCSPGVG